jgi:hypothetical protein
MKNLNGKPFTTAQRTTPRIRDIASSEQIRLQRIKRNEPDDRLALPRRITPHGNPYFVLNFADRASVASRKLKRHA